MSERQGWWAFHRKMWENPLFDGDGYAVAVWCWMLSEAAWQEGKSVFFRGERVYLKPGQFTAGYNQIAKKLGFGRQTVRRIVSAFKTNTLINQQSDAKKSLYTVVNWGTYQTVQHTDQHASNTLPTPTEQQNNRTSVLNRPIILPSASAAVDKRYRSYEERFYEEHGYYPTR